MIVIFRYLWEACGILVAAYWLAVHKYLEEAQIYLLQCRIKAVRYIAVA